MVYSECYNKQQPMGGDAATGMAFRSTTGDSVASRLTVHQLSVSYDYHFDYHSRPFRFYDLNGNCRSPEFTWILGSDQYAVEFVYYQGRRGVLPQILTDEETTYFKCLWGMEHY